MTEAVVVTAAFLLHQQSGARQRLRGSLVSAQARSRLSQPSGAKPEAEVSGDLAAQPAALQIIDGLVRLRMFAQLRR